MHGSRENRGEHELTSRIMVHSQADVKALDAPLWKRCGLSIPFFDVLSQLFTTYDSWRPTFARLLR